MGNRTIPPDIKGSNLLMFLWHVVHVQRTNLNLVTYGLPQTGKSSIDEALAFILDRKEDFSYDFNPDTQVAFGVENVFKIANQLDRRGKVLIAEEMGTQEGANAREWQSQTNKDLGDLFQILGFKGLIALINLPANMLLDKTPRTLVHGSITAKGLDLEEGYINGTFKINQMNPETSKIYRKYLRYFDHDGVKRKISSFRIKVAPRFIMNAFRKKENVWKRRMMAEKEKRVKANTLKRSSRDRSVLELKEILNYIEGNIKFFKGDNKKLNANDLILLMPKDVAQVSRSEARTLSSMINRHYLKV